MREVIGQKSEISVTKAGRLALLAGLLAGACGGAPASALAADAGGSAAAVAERPNQVTGEELTPDATAAIDRGLKWLASRQGKDGSFGGASSPTAVTSLAALSMMASGSLPGRGPYGDNVQRAAGYIVASSQRSGLLASDSSQGIMYSHGFATLFMAEVYGMTRDEQVGEALSRAVRLIKQAQNEEGGWRYMPIPADADISVTICQVMALRAARDAGIKVDRETIDKAVEYVRKCQNPDGGFSYQANRGFGGGGSGFERSAAGVATLYYAGIFEGNDLKRGLEYISRFEPGKNRLANQGFGHYFYGQYYAAQAMFLAGGDYWSNWYPAIRDELINRQKPDGKWEWEVSPEYCTAVSLIVLQMPNRYLPVFTGKGPGG